MLLEIRHLKKIFYVPKGTWGLAQELLYAVDDVDLFIREGEHLGLVGESGCGKTTLARLVLRLMEPDEGNIFFDGQEISGRWGSQLSAFRNQCQLVFQDPTSSLDPRFTVYAILDEALLRTPRLTKGEKEKRMRELLGAVGLEGNWLSRFPHEFSGGERQRIAIARGLIRHPRLLVLDEIVSALDVLVQDQILKLLLDIEKRFAPTYFFISHNLRVVKKICRRIAVMVEGKIVEVAPTEELLARPLHPFTQELLLAALEYRSVSGKGQPREIGGTLQEIRPGHWVRM